MGAADTVAESARRIFSAGCRAARTEAIMYVRSISLALLLLISAVSAAGQGMYVGQQPSPFPGEVRASLNVTYYDIQGSEPSELANAMRSEMSSRTGHQFYGLTRWHIAAEYQMVARGGRCRLQEVVVRVDTEIILPRWRPPVSASPEIVSDWRNFVAALERHERTHHRLIDEAAEIIRRRLVQLSTPTCQAMAVEARRVLERGVEEAEGRNNAYDQHTDHGRLEGATWPVRR